ncbi:TraR/DksA family transcriptional regulator [Streptomyces sp. AJS327]|uniref:TraR/DksA family transcriptional regulator n=1 Tax=Streptomyces sp. AJS327 TaxID=2545265 RepID=UPI0015E019C1|nr:TraR/DksA family transcriptional regulator [Streptomyces sp. AJS327]
MSVATFCRIHADQQIPHRLDAVGRGWHPLLTRLHTRLAALDPEYRLEELTPKLGGLRIYVADRFGADGEFDGAWADTVAQLADEAAVEAERTCELCGAPGRPRFHGDHRATWIRTVCTGCRDAPHPGGGPGRPLGSRFPR